ncbi:hypothetical protein DFH08DRAFT_881015 [Mycena albidolilacea]|uniref:Uncharacterized protein n=1 Tax=Mycena albidolilacea TaxID=1033008 RepID=A0AAD6ZP80_9AGAR|nr:hypothetical protein DFH08DRAFT_881015 [Mycena albidolilacea]
MTRKTVVLTPDERAICRVRYRHVATYMDPGPQPKTPNDRICQAIAAHWKNGAGLEHGSEYSALLFPFGNKRAVSRHINKSSPKTVEADREIARAWVETRPKEKRAGILELLGFVDMEGEDDDEVDFKENIKDEQADVKTEPAAEGPLVGWRDVDEADIKSEEAGIKQETVEGGSVAPKRKLEDVENSEDDKTGVALKRHREYATISTVKAETEELTVKIEA